MKKTFKKIVVFLLALTVILSMFACKDNNVVEGDGFIDNVQTFTPPILSSEVKASKNYYVSPNGSDNNAGTKDSPFLTLQCALLAVEKFKSEVKDDMTIFVGEGENYLRETVKINGNNNLPDNKILTIKGERKTARLNGGREVKNWQKANVNGIEMFKAKISDEDAVRSFMVNGKAKRLAGKYNERNSLYSMSGKASWNWEEKDKSIKITEGGADLSKIKNASQLELAMICEWKTFVFKTESISKNTVTLKQPYAAWFTTPASVGNLDPGGHWFPNPKHKLWLQNDVSLIDEPGEFCFDKAEKFIYYLPQEGEDLNSSVCVAAKLDTLLEISGGLDDKNRFTQVKNIKIENLGFAAGNFDILDEQGIGIVQGHEYYNGLTEKPGTVGDNTIQPTPSTNYEGNVLVKNAKNISFIDCNFTALSKMALHYDIGTQNSEIVGNAFYDLGDSAVVVSNPHNISSAGNDQVFNITVKNNLIRRTGNVNHTAPAIYGYYTNNLSIENNDIYSSTQCGISVGWGWYIMDLAHIGSNKILNNRVGFTGNTVRDGGPIYVLGRSKNGLISGNYVYDQRSAYAGLYLDEGSCNWTVENNLVDNVWGEFDDITWFRFNGFNGGPGGSTTVYKNILRNNFYTNPAEADIGNTSEEFKNIKENNLEAYALGATSDLTAKNYYPNPNPNWVAGAKEIFNNSGLMPSYSGLVTRYS